MIDKIPEALQVILIAMLGGLSNYLMDDDHSIFRLIASTITAGFAGYLAYLLCIHLGYSGEITSFICGISGLAGEKMLLVLRKIPVKFIKGKLGSMINDKEE